MNVLISTRAELRASQAVGAPYDGVVGLLGKAQTPAGAGAEEPAGAGAWNSETIRTREAIESIRQGPMAQTPARGAEAACRSRRVSPAGREPVRWEWDGPGDAGAAALHPGEEPRGELEAGR